MSRITGGSRRRGNRAQELDGARAEILAEHHCSACHARRGVDGSQLGLVAASLTLAPIGDRYPNAHGLCARHTLLLNDGESARLAKQHVDGRLGVLAWELHESTRKQAWAYRHELSGPEHDAWLRAGGSDRRSGIRRWSSAGGTVSGSVEILSLEQVAPRSRAILDEVERAVVGKREALELALAVLLAGGHVLIEDYPGLAKTLIARSFAAVTGIRCSRVQFTPDLMPSDVTGASIYNQRTGEFEFRPGPVFTNVPLADEINRAPPKTQAALLEAMQERQVTTDDHTRALDRPFLVLATQNPIEYEGTYALPEAQLDRFRGTLALMKLARVKAVLDGRDFVVPDDVKLVAVPALAHRLALRPELWVQRVAAENVIRECLVTVPVPQLTDDGS